MIEGVILQVDGIDDQDQNAFALKVFIYAKNESIIEYDKVKVNGIIPSLVSVIIIN